MAEQQEKKDLEIESLDATELEDENLEEVGGGGDNNCHCTVNPQ